MILVVYVCNIMIKNILKISSYEFMPLKFKIHFPKFLKAKEFVSKEKNLFLVKFATKRMH